MKQERNIFIDTIKYLCAIEVIWMHSVDPCTDLNSIMSIVNDIVMKIATVLPPVEVFFVLSGYFLFIKQPSFKAILTWEKKIYITYFLYSFLYLRQITEHFQGRSFFMNTISVIRQFFFTGYSIMGWFIPALAWGGAVVYVLLIIERRTNTRIYSRLFIFILAALSAIGSTYYYLFSKNPMDLFINLTGGIGILRGIIYVYIGYELTNVELEKKIAKKEIYLSIVMWGIMTLLIYCSQKNCLGVNTRGMITKYIYVASLSIVIMKLSTHVKMGSLKSLAIGKISLVMYFTHVFIIEHIAFVSSAFGKFVVAVVVSSFCGLLLAKGKDRGIRLCKYFL